MTTPRPANVRRFGFRQSERWLTVTILIVVIAYLAHDFASAARISPPPDGRNLGDLIRTLPPPNRLAWVVDCGANRLVWIGQLPRFTIRSGPPCYLFDEQGRLIDWTAETGEGWTYDELANAAYRARPVSAEEALRLCSTNGSDP